MSGQGGEGVVNARHRRGEPARRPSRMSSGFSTLRDVLLFVFGSGIVVNEVFLSDTVELYALTAGVAMLGLPLVFGADEKKVAKAAPPPEEKE